MIDQKRAHHQQTSNQLYTDWKSVHKNAFRVSSNWKKTHHTLGPLCSTPTQVTLLASSAAFTPLPPSHQEKVRQHSCPRKGLVGGATKTWQESSSDCPPPWPHCNPGPWQLHDRQCLPWSSCREFGTSLGHPSW